jgi:Alpha/beta hydrolase domain
MWSFVCALLVSGFSDLARAAAASPTLSAPVTGGNGIPLVFSGQPADAVPGVDRPVFDFASVGYSQTEYFLDGTASAYSPVGPLTNDGKWTVAPTSSAAYRTRIVVNRPIHPSDFNGTVLVEWLNVSGGNDASPDWMHTHVELIRGGYAWVGVSAQAVGLNALKGAPPGGDAVRYASLPPHPGDSYSYDMFSQAGQAIRDNAVVLLGRQPDRLIAAGESQSAGRMVTYIDAVHPVAGVYNGFLVHSRGANGAGLSQAPLATVNTPTPTLIRDDLGAPVLVFTTETDTGSLQARQPDSAIYRLWEVAGTAHFDLYGLKGGATDTGRRPSVTEWFDSMLHPTNEPSERFTCLLPINSGPATFVLRAAIADLDRWVADGTLPPIAPRLVTSSTTPPYAQDANGNVLGGIRTPAVDAPVAKLSGLFGGGTFFCFLFGTTTPFTPEKLEELYVNHDGFVSAWSKATQKAVKSGFVLKDDGQNLKVVGAQSDFLP